MKTNICKFCHKTFQAKQEKVFCSPECRSKFRASQVKYLSFTCEQCGKVFQKTEREVKNAQKKNSPIRFCSKKCKSDFWGRNREEHTCPICGKKFLAQKGKGDNVCCSSECFQIKKSQVYVSRICQFCGKEFTRKASHCIEGSKDTGDYCSTKCANLAKRKYAMVQKQCKNCQSIFWVKESDVGVFCSIECKREFETKQKVSLVCQYCGKSFVTTNYKANIQHRKYCNIDCRNKARERDRDTYEKISHYLRSSSQYANWRNSVLAESGYKCQKCGAYGPNIILHAHHKVHLYKICKKYNFDEQAILNSKIFTDTSNGQCLCESCHQNIHYHLRKEFRNSKGQFCRPDSTT